MSKRLLPDEFQALLKAHPALKRLARAAQAAGAPAAGKQARGGLAPDPRQSLPPALRERVQLLEEEHHWLALVETSATAQLLRFHLPRLERALPGGKIKIVVTGKRNAAGANVRPAPTSPRLDADSAEHIRRAADTIDDPGLQAALRRLASRGER